jgi:hypothetical protein
MHLLKYKKVFNTSDDNFLQGDINVQGGSANLKRTPVSVCIIAIMFRSELWINQRCRHSDSNKRGSLIYTQRMRDDKSVMPSD